MHNRYFSFCFQFERLKREPCYLALYRQRTEKVASWCILYIWHTYWLCLWRHCYILLGTKWQPLRSCFRAFPAFFNLFFYYYYYFLTNENQMTIFFFFFFFFFFFYADSKIIYKLFLNIWTNMMLLRFSSSLNIMNQSIAIFLCLSAMFLLLFWPNDVAVDHFYNYIEGIFGFLSSSIHSTNEDGNPCEFGNRW